jgi:cell division protease FtsH
MSSRRSRQSQADPDPAGRRPERQSPEPGWRVTPAPDGRGAPEGGDQPTRPVSRWPLLLLVAMLVLNLVLSRAALGPAERIRIPYQPTFLDEIRTDNVRSISTTDGSVRGS